MVREMESTGKPAKRYITVAHLEELPEGGSLLVQKDGHDIALFRVQDEVFAMSDLCPHMGDSLSAGQLWEGTIICPRHMWAFRLKDGVCEDVPNLRATLYEVRLVEGEIQVALPPERPPLSAETGECGDCNCGR
ncbi:MAG: Rieske (2Fe-2S) protein [Thermogutta sp.]|nr:Rieske (2Fe-2S) protein [Thermogutta sp.]